MRRMILRMIATGSLSAFSASALQGPGALGGAIWPPRVGTLPGAPAAPAGNQAAPDPAAVQPGRTPPRGSLLDLSV